jgi:hypothetical protein
MQHDLFPRAPFSLTPESGRKEPRLWIRRLVIWRNPGEIIRSVDLRPGLNVVWSRDPGSGQTGPIGHGGGKTMFCRLLRYCLGEESFAPEVQRHRIADKLPNGRVGAEVILDGESWAVVRSLGAHRHDVVVKGGALSDARRETVSPTGMAPLRNALVQKILGDAAKLFPRTIGESAEWQATLAWLTRDQECRFAGHLEWRDPHSDSRSPVRGRSMEDRLAIVRALIGALTTAEIGVQQLEEEEDRREKDLRAETTRLDWEINREHARLAIALGPATGPAIGHELDVAHFKSAAAARYAEALRLPVGKAITDLERARGRRAELTSIVIDQEKALSDVAARIEERTKGLGQLRGELPTSRARVDLHAGRTKITGKQTYSGKRFAVQCKHQGRPQFECTTIQRRLNRANPEVILPKSVPGFGFGLGGWVGYQLRLESPAVALFRLDAHRLRARAVRPRGRPFLG